MARRLINLLLFAAALAPAAGSAQSFGRFGYVSRFDLPGFTVDSDGFVVSHPAADRIRFARPARVWKPTATSDMEQTVALGGPAGNPAKVRASLLAPGFALYFEKGLSLKVGSTGAPYLTWREGSAASGVPTPNVRWVVLSFRDAQPPLVLGFPDGPSSLTVTGKPGAWTIEGAPDFRGWVRVGLPVGLQPAAANSAAALGRLAESAAEEEDIWSHNAPVLQNLTVQADEDSVVADWTFSRVGALLPRAAVLAEIGGYPLKVLSPARRMKLSLGEGPASVCKSTELRIRLPIRRVPTGRGLSVGADLSAPMGTVSPFDVPSIVELSLETLSATRDIQTRHSAEETGSEYLSQAAYFKEPWSDQLLPYDAAGVGIDLASAHALLSQAVTASTRATSEDNALLTSVAWRRDWHTWLPWVADPNQRRRAAALSALAGVLCPEPERRLSAAMFQAGLSAERGLEIWRRRTGQTSNEAKLLEPMPGLRQALFRLAGLVTEEARYADTWLSPVRVFSDVPLHVTEFEKNYTVEWPVLEPKASVLRLAAGYEIRLDAISNLPRYRVDQALGTTEVLYTPETTGICQARLFLPDWAKPLPRSRSIPRYSEAAK
ncbi:hypothetical protein [Fimbriimonas ginsengisoli]|uniref:Uncharacterized protein n=1 Tax=Fimbriimonas ginsengisoli Gsoil 348 TaxID=661478 RepID=A0A068NME5_FIMGI|nr:hypothetical protein [Fimbriimonas ginsengisoli]AIE84626.1 hypothetical protein OP10G_1258 [Fimbriimonas ginsengisoli Gsoil 348]